MPHKNQIHSICQRTAPIYLLSSICPPHTLFHTLFFHTTYAICGLAVAQSVAVCNTPNQFHKLRLSWFLMEAEYFPDLSMI